MITPPKIVHEAHGSPSVADCVDRSGRCYVCGGEIDRGRSVQGWLSSNFTDQTRCRAPTSDSVCEACCYVQSRTSPVLGRPPKLGKKFGGNFRNYSHGADERGYFNASKGEKDKIREFLSRSHRSEWFLAVADSGQKHVLSFAPMNGAGRSGVVLFEESMVTVPDDQDLLDSMGALLSSGVTKDEIARGEYYVRTMIENRERVHSFECSHGPERGGEWFRLALWLAQRNEEEFKVVESARKVKKNAGRKSAKATRDARRGDDSNPAKRVSCKRRGAPSSRLLDAAAKQVPGGSEANNDSERMGGGGAETDGNSSAPQLGLPGVD